MKTRILIVESEESVRSLLKSRLEQDGYSVLTAATVDEAVGKLSEMSTTVNRNLVSLSEARLQKLESVKEDKGTPHLQLVSGSGLPAEVFSSGLSYTELKKNWSDSFEREYLLGTLNRHGGNVSAAARQAKLDRSNFLRLLRRHGLHASEFRKDLKDSKETPETKKIVVAA
jgi:DNA-binding NtrC family response regulator